MTLLADLERDVGASALSTDLDVIAAHARDQAPLVHAGAAQVLVRPKSASQVAAVLRIAGAHSTPVVPRGAGSGLSGGANAVDDCVMIVMTGMDRIIDIDVRDGIAVVQPGVCTADLKAAVAAAGLAYPPDPASATFCTIGGNVATDAGGLCCAKHGSTRHWVRGLEVVLADGRIARTGGRTHASSAGYDLTGLFVGSEGTLGVITEVTLRLAPTTPPLGTLVGTFGRLRDAMTAVVDTMRSTTPTLLEMMDRVTIHAINHLSRMDIDDEAEAILLAQVEVSGAVGGRDVRNPAVIEQ